MRHPYYKGGFMKLYAILITKFDIDLITFLNEGVTPEIEEKPTYFIFDATWNSDVPNEIVTEDELLERTAAPRTASALWHVE
jgi:hypothetical protein